MFFQNLQNLVCLAPLASLTCMAVSRTLIFTYVAALLCKARWNNIRDNYRKSLRKRTCKTALGNKRIKKYKYENVLHFLNNYFQEREPKMNAHPEDSQLEEPDGAEAEVRNFDSDSETNLEEPQSPIDRCKPSSSISIKKRLEDFSEKLGSLEVDHVDIFLNAIAPTLKSFTPYYLNLAKSKIFATVQEYELAMIMDQQKRSSDCGGYRVEQQSSFFPGTPSPGHQSPNETYVESKQCFNQ